jgi:hypothetical protein
MRNRPTNESSINPSEALSVKTPRVAPLATCELGTTSDHFVQFYEHDGFLMESAANFFASPDYS